MTHIQKINKYNARMQARLDEVNGLEKPHKEYTKSPQMKKSSTKVNKGEKPPSGSSRDKTEPTPKQNKWNDVFYARSACSKGNYTILYTKWLRMKIKKSPLN